MIRSTFPAASTSLIALGMASALMLSATPAVFAQSTGPAALSAQDMTAEIQSLDAAISEAEAEAAQYDGGFLALLVQSRVDTLKLTKAIIANRLAADAGGATVEISIPSVQPDPEKAASLIQQIAEQQGVIAQAQTEAQGSGGLVQALALSRLSTEKLTLSQLRSAWIQAEYGIAMSLSAPGTAPSAVAAPASSASASEPTADASVAAPSWADPAYPNVDFNRDIFAQLDREDFDIAGWWGISITRAEIDDSERVLALNVSEMKDGFQVSNPQLQATCNEGTAALIFNADTFIISDFQSSTLSVTYRIDEQPAVTDRWNKVTSNKGAGLFGPRGQQIIRELYDSNRLFVRLTDNNGENHDATFELDGATVAFDAVAAACGFSTLNLTKEDYRSIQTLLNAGGFPAGTPDGVWGKGSADALRA